MYLIDVIKQRLKKFVLPILSQKNYLLGALCLDQCLTLTVEEAEKIVSQYCKIPTNPFINGFTSLSDISLDLSIIIPVYNADKYLDKCLDSILNQNTKYLYEVICINDGSTDDSLKILKDYQAKYRDKLIIIDQKNQGISVARNSGIEVAKGAYIGFMDNDDTVSEDYVDYLLRYAKEYNSDIVQVGYLARDTQGIEHLRYVKQFVSTGDDMVISKYCSGYIWSGIYKKTLWDKIRFPAGYWYEDMITRLLIMRIAKSYVMVDKPLYNKLIHSGNASITLWKASNPKSIEAYYLAKYGSDYGVDVLGLVNNSILMRQLMYEYSVQLRQRISKLTLDVQKAIFILAARDICTKFKDNLLSDNKLYTNIYNSFKRGEFNKWRYYSLALAWASN